MTSFLADAYKMDMSFFKKMTEVCFLFIKPTFNPEGCIADVMYIRYFTTKRTQPEVAYRTRKTYLHNEKHG